MPDDALPEHLRDKPHSDYPRWLRWVPRAWTSFKWGAPELIAGGGSPNSLAWVDKEPDGSQMLRYFQRYAPKPINPPGGWQLSRYPDAPGLLRYLPLYLAFTTKGGTHFRIGARWDDVDNYVTFPSIALKRHIGG